MTAGKQGQRRNGGGAGKATRSDDELPAEGDRLQKVLAAAGYGSRRVCEDLIFAGRVKVNGKVAQLGRRVDPERDKILVDGAPVSARPGMVHYLLNKPANVVTTADDPQGRKIVTELVPSEPRVFSVGRLDYETEGLLIMTNDGDLTHQLTHPSFGVEKEYLAHVEGEPDEKVLNHLRKGVQLDDGITAPAKVGTLGKNVIRITIHEGKNRQVRRMCEAVGHPVLRLVRVRIGPIIDKTLKPGAYRLLTQDEVRQLAEAASGHTAKASKKNTFTKA